MNSTNIPISVLIITCIWLSVIAMIVFSKYRNRQDVDLIDIERRKGERRETSRVEPVVNVEEISDDGAEMRNSGNRRAAKDWKKDYRTIRARVENETGAEDF